MSKNLITVGSRYHTKVSGKFTVVKITKQRNDGGWYAVNEATNRPVVIKPGTKLSLADEQPVTTSEVTQKLSPARGESVVEAPIVDFNRSVLSELKKTVTPATDNGAPHLVAKAYAGTGKTFTEIMGVAHSFAPQIWDKVVAEVARRSNKDPREFKIVPSPEQAAIWEEMARGRGHTKSVVYAAFNKSIVTEFSEKWGWLVEMLGAEGINLRFATINSLGNADVKRAFGFLNVSDFHTQDLLAEVMGLDSRELRYKEPVLVKAVVDLVGYCKLTLAGWTEEEGFDPDSITEEVLDQLTAHFDVELNGLQERVYKLVPQVLREALDVAKWRRIDFNDQNWLPVVLNLPVSKADFLMVDEGQDLPRCKQEYARKAGRRIMLVGDVWQAIYGFAGADVDSIPRMIELLGQDPRGVTVLGLTETRRCGKAIVTEAARIVEDFRAHESNPAGKVSHTTLDKYEKDVIDGDMVLCRVNAPLVSQALRFIKAGRKALIRGRDFGGQLGNFVERLKAKDVGELIEKVEDWAEKESQKEARKKNPSEAKLLAINDRKECILAFASGALSVEEVRERINLVFAGKECPKCKKHYNETSESCYGCKVPLVTPKGVLFSSVHRAKGLEAAKVFLLAVKGAGMPHPMAKTQWQIGQEMNLKYVAITRAIHELVWVADQH